MNKRHWLGNLMGRNRLKDLDMDGLQWRWWQKTGCVKKKWTEVTL